MTTGLEERLHHIYLNTKKNSVKNKKNWYKVGKALLTGTKVRLHNKSKVRTRRIYRLYSVMKGNWNSPLPRQLSKMNKSKFDEILEVRQQDYLVIELLTQFSLKETVDRTTFFEGNAAFP